MWINIDDVIHEVTCSFFANFLFTLDIDLVLRINYTSIGIGIVSKFTFISIFLCMIRNQKFAC